MSVEEKINNLINPVTCTTVEGFLDRLDILIGDEIGVECTGGLKDDNIVDEDFMKEIKEFDQSKGFLHFGKTLKDLKCEIFDNNFTEHVIWIQYNGPKKLCIKEMNLPRSHIQDQIYSSIDEIVKKVKKHLEELSGYFDVLSRIDHLCTVIEPVRPTFKENYRKIQLVDKIWLHIEISPEGTAKNLSPIGQFDQKELQELLHAWDHSNDIVANLSMMRSSLLGNDQLKTNSQVKVPDCALCFCHQLENDIKVPQPLCSNPKCGAYFHRSCLYLCLNQNAESNKLQYVDGKCPCCFQYIHCSAGDI